jgi:uncharacterized protein (DUF1697 family)
MDKMKYIAFFRGINVGGRHMVKMAELRQLFTDLNFHEVKTYIQSGNVFFSSDIKKAQLPKIIEAAFMEKFGFGSSVVIRTDAEITDIIKSIPFSAADIDRAETEAPGVEHLYIYMSDCPIDAVKAEQLRESSGGKDMIHIHEYEIYLLCFQSVRDSKPAALLAKLPQPPTARNINTLRKISLMFQEKCMI